MGVCLQLLGTARRSRANADIVGLAYAIENRAMLAILEDDWGRAAPLLREVFELCERHAVTAPLPEALSGAAAIASVHGSDQAARLFRASRALRSASPSRLSRIASRSAS